MMAAEVLDAMGSVAAGQWGLVTTGQAVAAGVPAVDVARAANRGLVRRVRHGVYAMYGGATGDHLEDIRAEWLATDSKRTAAERRGDLDQVVVSDESAAEVYGIGDMPGGGVHLTAARRIRPSATTPVTAHRRTLHPREVEWVDGLPVTSVRRTLEDLAMRWEPGHIRDAANDALGRGLIRPADIAKSPGLMDVVPELAPAPTTTGLRQRLRNARPSDPAGAMNEFFRLQFLGLLSERQGWVLKGGTNLLCRLAEARSTKDLDLFLDSFATAEESARLLVGQMDGAMVGRYRFELGQPQIGDEGHLDVARLDVKVTEHATDLAVSHFSVDVAGAVTLNAAPIRHEVRVPVAVPGYHNTIGIQLYPIENQLADKLCAPS